MYAVIKQGGHQYRVAPGDIIQIEKIEAEKGDVITLEDVLLVRSGETLEIGEPRVNGAAISAKVLRQDKSPKVEIYKFKRRHGYEKHQGHRQPFTEIQITGFTKNGKALS
ncbi:MAG TPA: 50S ribosomal protein L21 [Candidatus Sumerlaeota bacterium]|nr:50S ribosomal protein L21 [Candidatus Sumerlaeota bacterium]HMX61525.1 50S ribosomal protein L21 [Candidatus Sumerlaeota bacterium]